MARISTGIVALVISGLTGCVAAPHASVERERLHELETELQRQQAVIQELKDRNLVLEKRLKTDVESQRASTSPTPPPSGKRVPSRAPVRQEPTGDQLLYSKILQTYRKKNPAEMEKSLGLLLKSYPESVYADNALYLAGQLAYELGDFSLARRRMDRVLALYPKGNKAVSALFAKAMIEKKMSRSGEAKKLLETLRESYPGSPESLRVATELKLIETNSNGSKRGM